MTEQTKTPAPLAVFPKLGDYAKSLNRLVENCLGYKTMICPPITKRTVEIGAKHSPDTVCTPFKLIMGNFIESMDKGANVLIMPAFGCRLGFYDLLHKQILTDLGYKFEMIALFDYVATAQKLYQTLNGINPELTREKFDAEINAVAKEIVETDKHADEKRRKGTGIKIGLCGDLYSVIEPHGNCDIEKWLAKHNVNIVRYTDLTYLAKNMFDIPRLISQSGGYVDYYIGGNANCTIAQAFKMVSDEHVDGIIHMKAATCAPEITAMSILQNMSRDFNTPVMYLTFDTETSEAGLHTRLEAFLDMLEMKKERK
jgi:predicted nucleotide-binding protein (sugar kinase/HSP70/actin superfamily)